MWNRVFVIFSIFVIGGCGFSKYEVVQLIEEDFFNDKRIYHLENQKTKNIEILNTKEVFKDGDIIIYHKKKQIIK